MAARPPQGRGISDATAKTQLASIFDKTGTHRQAELIRLLLDAADAKKWKNERHRQDRRQTRSPYLFGRVAAASKIVALNRATTNGYTAFFGLNF